MDNNTINTQDSTVIGLRGFYMAKYGFENSDVRYTDGGVFFDAVSFQNEPQVGEVQKFYVNNVVKYQAGGDRINSENLTFGTDGLSQFTTMYMLGIEPKQRNIDGNIVETIEFDDDIQAPYLGIGYIETNIAVDGSTTYKPVVYLKARFNVTGQTINTKGENYEWQTKSVTASAIGSDEAKRPVRVESASMLATFEEADAFVRSILAIPMPTPGQIG
ncbi:MAG: hypothetical protein FWH32_00620 [Clostridiales bacterium]|nr:hypothetical protein [Clostridiales bacterium]